MIEVRRNDLQKVVQHLMYEAKVLVGPADTYVKMPELSIEEVLSIIEYPRTEPIDEDDPWPHEARLYASTLLRRLQDFMRKEVSELLC